ncbi:unnamed protein product [Prorocentrum cordatum]|uniref:Uncharacterized protein n=1 Tax=Prorocentrum cordatum TaxID=2364126 RepID=A0ABN9W4W3_9DINO|nr:unnamed protein product [Polarella glacialis]
MQVHLPESPPKKNRLESCLVLVPPILAACERGRAWRSAGQLLADLRRARTAPGAVASQCAARAFGFAGGHAAAARAASEADAPPARLSPADRRAVWSATVWAFEVSAAPAPPCRSPATAAGVVSVAEAVRRYCPVQGPAAAQGGGP